MPASYRDTGRFPRSAVVSQDPSRERQWSWFTKLSFSAHATAGGAQETQQGVLADRVDLGGTVVSPHAVW